MNTFSLLVPLKKIKEEMMMIKEEFHHRHNHVQAIKSKPHITLANFGAYISIEEILILQINELVKFFEPFKVTLSGVSNFSTHTIFIDIIDQKPIVDLVKSLQQSLMLPAKSFSKHPHMTIAKGLEPNKFQEAMVGLEGVKYADSFLVDKIVLMKRKGRFDRYEMVKEFKLGMK